MRLAVLFGTPMLALSLLAQAPGQLDGWGPDPAWFGPGITWTHLKGVDFAWVRPGARLDRPLVDLAPWELPRFVPGKDALDHALEGQVSEELQAFLRENLGRFGGVQPAKAPGASPYRAVGRVVDATHIREGATITLGILAGLPTKTWAFKVVDVRTGETLLATHHKAVGGGHVAWVQFVCENLGELAGLPKADAKAWDRPAGAEDLPGGGWCWSEEGFSLEGAVHLLPWVSQTASSQALWRAWSSGVGQALASAMAPALARQMQGRIEQGEAEEAAYLLQGSVFSAPRYLKARYRAALMEAASGRVVARIEVLSPFTPNPPPKVAARMVGALQKLRGGPAAAAAPPVPAAPDLWEGTGRLEPAPGAVDAVWIDPAFSLKGRTLQVGDWLPPALPEKSDGTDRAFAAATTLDAPGWLLGALVPFLDRGLRVSRTEGELKLEGRVVAISEANIMNFGRGMAAALTLGLAGHSHQVFQIRVVDRDTRETLLLVQQKVVSFKVASTGTSYKAMKWMAQDFVPWLVRAGLKEPAAPSP